MEVLCSCYTNSSLSVFCFFYHRGVKHTAGLAPWAASKNVKTAKKFILFYHLLTDKDITHDLAYCSKLTKYEITVFCFKCYIKEQKSYNFSAFTIETFLFFVTVSHWLKEQHYNLFCHFKHLVIKVYVRGPVLILYLFMKYFFLECGKTLFKI